MPAPAWPPICRPLYRTCQPHIPSANPTLLLQACQQSYAQPKSCGPASRQKYCSDLADSVWLNVPTLAAVLSKRAQHPQKTHTLQREVSLQRRSEKAHTASLQRWQCRIEQAKTNLTQCLFPIKHQPTALGSVKQDLVSAWVPGDNMQKHLCVLKFPMPSSKSG